MENVPPIPPLFCNTPPPIDFVDDDDYGDFAVAADVTEENKNIDGCPFEELDNFESRVEDCSYIPNDLPPPLDADNIESLDTTNSKYANNLNNLNSERDKDLRKEAFLQKKDTIDSNEGERIIKNNDNHILITEDKRKENSISCDIVTIEDITDDSDEEYYSNNSVSEGDDLSNFYEIKFIETNEKIKAENNIREKNEKEECDVKTTENETITSIIENETNIVENEDGDIFNPDFTKTDCFDDLPKSLHSANDVTNQNTLLKNEVEQSNVFRNISNDNFSAIISQDIVGDNVGKNNDDDDDDDEFGDFAEATIDDFHSSPQIKESNLMSERRESIVSQNLNERLCPLLEMIFPKDTRIEHEEEINRSDTFKISEIAVTGVDSAKALNYQWINSGVRNCLIRSLGIDSRNILYGENWNSSMPRFAANLSSDPLKPMKSEHENALSSGNIEALHKINLKESTFVDSSKKDVDMLRKNEENYTVEALDIISNTNMKIITNEHLEISMENRKNAENFLPTCNGKLTLESGKEPSNIVQNELNEQQNLSKFNLFSPGYQRTDDYLISGSSNLSSLDNSGMNSEIINDNDTDQNLSPVIANVIPSIIENSLKFNVEDEVVTTSTYSGPLKETHIFTPSKSDETLKRGRFNSSFKSEPIDFDYEKAAAGIIIDEAVVKKEYRDVEYNPGFSLEYSRSESNPNEKAFEECQSKMNVLGLRSNVSVYAHNYQIESKKEIDIEDEFSDFQSVLPPTTNSCQKKSMNSEATTNNTTNDEMILCPSILLPKAVSLNSSKPKIEWGDSVASINPEELARIEELFPQPQIKQTPYNTTQQQSPTISARIAHQEKYRVNDKHNDDDDDDWSDFLSVPITVNTNSKYLKTNITPSKSDTTNEDEWSDFVSSVPGPITTNAAIFNNSLRNSFSISNQCESPNKLQINTITNSKNHNNNNNHIKRYNTKQNFNNPSNAMPIIHDFSTLPTTHTIHPNVNIRDIRTFNNIGYNLPVTVKNNSFISSLGFNSTTQTSKTAYSSKK